MDRDKGKTPVYNHAAAGFSSPPRTPPEQTAGSHLQTTPTRDNPQRELADLKRRLLDEANGTDMTNSSINESGDERDPHDLSLSPKHAARTSIVDNMLLSLDQFSGGTSVLDDYRLFNSVLEPDFFNRDSPDSDSNRYRSDTVSSLSSDPAAPDDRGVSHYGFQSANGRRSAASANHPSSSPRGAGSGRGYDSMPSRTQPNIAGSTSLPYRASKGSMSSNMDYATMRGHRGRADSGATDAYPGSVDTDDKTIPFPPYQDETPQLDEDLDAAPTPSVPVGQRRFQSPTPSDRLDSLDAAPTPSVPAGPRRYQSPTPSDHVNTLNPQPSMATIASKSSTRSSSRPNPKKKKSRPENLDLSVIRKVESDMALKPPPALDSMDPPAPSPTISFNRPAFPSFPPPPPPAAENNTPKERPGFFKRVFGSSKNESSAPAPASAAPTPSVATSTTTATTGTGTDAAAAAAAENLSHSNPNPSREPAKLRKQSFMNEAPAPSPPPRQVVNKKSSFFRRRKKSVVETDSSVPPPITIPQHLNPKIGHDSWKPQPSPVSSLRQVMNPFLADSQPQPQPQQQQPVNRTSREYHGRETSMEDADPTRSNALAAQKKRGSSVPPPGGSQRSQQPPLSLGGALDTSVGGNNSVDDEDSATTPRSGDVGGASPPLASPNRGKDSLTGGSIAGQSTTTRLAPPMISVPPSSLSPVAEDYSQKSASPRSSTERPKPPKLIIPGSDNDMSETGNKDANVAETTSRGSRPDGVEDADAKQGPTAADREQAQKLFDSQDEVVGNEPAAAWLGDPDRGVIREAYMELFDWSNMHILASMRSLCGRLILKGETQQIDRVLDAFSTRWCRCNPNHGFKASDVVHTICYSLLLLNTDLHLADIESKMTKAQFVRNTLPTIHRVAIDAAPEEFDSLPSGKVTSPTSEQPSKLVNRLSRADLSSKPSVADFDGETGPLVSTPFHGTMRAWEQQVETVLKDFYNSIQKERLPLFGAHPEATSAQTPSSALLGPSHNPSLRRTPSTVSKSGSDVHPRGRSADSRYGVARWSSKPRSRARLYPPSAMGSSRTSLDDQSSLWSPSASSTWSKYSLGKLTSVSVDSFGSDYPRGDYQQSIGFANALSQAIIREDSANSIASADEHATPLLEDETLQLAGAPWAKEGSLKHKHHLDSVDKRSKDRNWNKCFAVIQQGWMRLFSFNPANNAKQRLKGKRQPGSVVVGGGNWMSNAEEVWKFLLRQTIASALPPPGYSKSRPHVWALSLPTGAVHLFQVGTPEIVREFVSSANYWSARLSKQPLVGGVSNIEYGWSDAVINSALINNESNNNTPNNNASKRPPSATGTRTSIQSSIRSSVDHQVARPKLPADRVHISDWAPPQQSMVASNLPEEEQLKSLQEYVKKTEDEFQRHNERRPAMILAFSPRHPNASKAMTNFEKKSSYLLREIVKFRTYIDSLNSAIEQKKRIYGSDEDAKPAETETAAPADGPKEAVPSA